MAIYDEGAGEVDLAEFAGKPCWLAVDMSSTIDLTAIVACFRDDEDGYAVAPWFFIPADNLQKRADADGVPYPRWAKEGHIAATPGNAIDYRTVEACIRDLCERFDVREIAFDKAYSQAVAGPLTDDGFPVVTVQQGWVTESPALNELERAIVSRRLRHGGHPVLKWCFENVAIYTDSAGNRTMHKGKSRDRIDGAVACWMAVVRAATGDSNASIYSDASARPEGFLFV
jgi:phage terminase large subunit-like protein